MEVPSTSLATHASGRGWCSGWCPPLEIWKRKEMLMNHALVVKEEGSLGLRSVEELKGVIFHHFGFRKHEVCSYHSFPDPFILIISDRHARDVVFVAVRAVEGPVQLRFNS
jgi:hypothetical protein